ncbi:MAG: phosphoribosylglycinamide formyltransferase [Gammaproteobacteria bacterium]
MNKPLTLAVLISGNGSNLQAIMDAITDGLPAKIAVVISNRKDAYGLVRAQQAGIPTHVLLSGDYPDRFSFDQALQNCLASYQPDLIILAGFMRILGADFISHFSQRILNIHPSLLPKYPGLHTHQQVLAQGDQQHGATVHVVTEVLDGGPIIAYAALEVAPADTVESLQAKVHQLEHKLYPYVIRLFATQHLQIGQDCVILNGNLLPPQGLEYKEGIYGQI